jgi:hypothetical protein
MIPRPSFKQTEPEGERETSSSEEGEYIFRYPLDKGSGSDFLNLPEMAGAHLRALLDLLTPTWRGKPVRIDGYRLLDRADEDCQLYPADHVPPEEAGPLDIYEPRLPYIRKMLETVLSLVDLEYQGKPVPIDGFCLKHPRQWLKPGGGASDILAQAATRCNLKCRFCYNLGSPPALKTTTRRAEEEYQEILTRIACYVPGSKMGLFPEAGSPCEMLTHPRILDILTALRQKTGEVLRLPTNGSLLSAEMIQALSRYRPLFVDVSLNSSSPNRRRWLMKDPHPETALDSLKELESARIPYSVVIVPWPFPAVEEMVEDLGRTAIFSAGFSPAYIQISLPGYSRLFSGKTLFDREEVWGRRSTVP